MSINLNTIILYETLLCFMHNFVIDNYVVRLQINMSYNLMLTSGKKIPLCATKKKNILTLVLSEKKILNEAKKHNPLPPLQVKWSVPNNMSFPKAIYHF